MMEKIKTTDSVAVFFQSILHTSNPNNETLYLILIKLICFSNKPSAKNNRNEIILFVEIIYVCFFHIQSQELMFIFH